MQTSYWGFGLVTLGVAIVGLMISVQGITTTSTQDYLSVKEITEASMLEAVDYAYYRDYNEIKINKEKFEEVFIRMLSEVMGAADTYKVNFYGVYEAPPKVSVEVKSSSGTNFVSSGYDLVTRHDAIIQIHSEEVITNRYPSNSQSPSGSGGNSGTGGTTTNPGSGSNLGTTTPGTNPGSGSNPGTTTPGTNPGGGSNPGSSISPSETLTTCDGSVRDIDAKFMKGYIMDAQTRIYKNSTLSNYKNSIVETFSTKPEEVTILGELQSNSNYLAVQTSDGECGYIHKNKIAVNLEEYLAGYPVEFPLPNASRSIYQVTTRVCTVKGSLHTDCRKDAVFRLYSSNNGQLYTGEYLPLARYVFAHKLKSAVQVASNNNDILQIYDAYRPKTVSTNASNVLRDMIKRDSKIWDVLHTGYGASGTAYRWEGWTEMGDEDNYNWFLASGSSAHNRACAVDISIKNAQMPSDMHELSTWSVKYYTPIKIRNQSLTYHATLYSKGMLNSPDAQKLDKYMTNAGLDDLASEWWHYQDDACFQNGTDSNFYSNV